MDGDVRVGWDHMRGILLRICLLFICQAAQQRFDEALAGGDLKGLIAVLAKDANNVDPSVKKQHAMRLACDSGCLPLLDLLLKHPFTHLESDFILLAIAKDHCDVVERLIVDGKVDVSPLYTVQLSPRLRYLLSNIPHKLLKACTENDSEYIRRFNSFKLRSCQLDMLVARASKYEKSKEALHLLQLAQASIPRQDAQLLELMSRHPEWKTAELTVLLKPWAAAQLGLKGAFPEDLVDRISEMCIPDPITWRYSLRPHIEFALVLYSLSVCFQGLDIFNCRSCSFAFIVATLAKALQLRFKRHKRQLSLSQIPGRLLILNGMALILFIGALPFLDVGEIEYAFNQLAYVIFILYVYISINR